MEEKKKRQSIASGKASHNNSQKMKQADVYQIQKGEGKENVHNNSMRQASAKQYGYNSSQQSKKSFLTQTTLIKPSLPTTAVCLVDLLPPAGSQDPSDKSRQSVLSSAQSK